MKLSLSSPAVEEFFNRNHSKSDGKFTSGGGSSRVKVSRDQAAKFQDAGKSRNFPSNNPRGSRHAVSIGITGHTKALLDKQTGKDKSNVHTTGHGKVWAVKSDSKNGKAYLKALAAVRKSS